MIRYRVVKDEYPSDKYGVAVLGFVQGEWRVMRVIPGITKDKRALSDQVSICNVLGCYGIDSVIEDFKVHERYLEKLRR